MRLGDLILIVILIGVLGFGIYVLWLYFPAESIAYEPMRAAYQSNISSSVLGSQLQFYPRMRYPNREISYHFEPECDAEKKRRVDDALNLLSEKTILSFYFVEQNAQLEIVCSEIAPTAEQRNHFIAGEGGPTSIINTTKYYVILGGKISLFRTDSCETPNIALHEILHALGFDHNQDIESIMYPVTNCNQEIDESLISAINDIYTAKTAPDLALLEVRASKSGRYLSFQALVMNQGLQNAQQVQLSVFADGELVKSFDLQDILLGTRKSLEVENLPISRTSDKVTFAISGIEEELSIDNNQVSLAFDAES